MQIVNKVLIHWFDFGKVDDHIYKPQQAELANMPHSHLLILAEAEPSSSLSSLMKLADFDQTLLTHLIKRRNIGGYLNAPNANTVLCSTFNAGWGFGGCDGHAALCPSYNF